MMDIERFPSIGLQDEDNNPAYRLFGRRFYKDQTAIEYLVEFLLVFASPKAIGESKRGWVESFPDSAALTNWPSMAPLKYYPKARLVLKLFSFLGSSNLETRHDCHREHFNNITNALSSRLHVSTGSLEKDDILTFIEEILMGFVGIAQNRTWCAHSFLPITKGLLARETIWRKRGRNLQNITINWDDALEAGHFSFADRAFLARGGELLFLQLCNLFRRVDSTEIAKLEKRMNHKPGTGRTFHYSIECGLKAHVHSVPALNKLTDWIESVDRKTEEGIAVRHQEARCGWCPEESWREAYLFAYELNNLCSAAIDPLEKCELLTLCCVLQVLRSLCAQAARHWQVLESEGADISDILGYCWLLTDSVETDGAIKELSRRNVTRIQEMIYGAIREVSTDTQRDKYKKADEQGQGLFLKLAKTIGLIVPPKGPGARFVVTERLIRFFVLALIPPGERVTLKRFQAKLFDHFGIAFCGEELSAAVRWTLPHKEKGTGAAREGGLEKHLSATGCLITLSDALSLVQNPFGRTSE